MAKKILHVHEPLIAHLPQNAMLLSIVGETPSEYSWIMNNFVNIRMNKHNTYDDFYREDMWFNCYYIQDNAISKKFISSVITDDFVEFLINSINNGYYIVAYLNTKNISAYNRNHDNRHSPMIYGYDSDQQVFYIADFFKYQKFQFITVSFEEIRASFVYDEESLKWYKHKLFRCFKKKEEYHYVFSLNDLRVKVKDFYESKNFHQNGYYQFQTNDLEDKLSYDGFFAYETSFGLSCYDLAIEIIEQEKTWMRFLHLFYCHKVLMKLRLDYLNQHYQLKDYGNLMNICDNMLKINLSNRNLFLKILISGESLSGDTNKRILKNMIDLKKMDYYFTEILLNDLNSLL